MGKGKAKGFRPPRGDDPNTGMLYGSAAHLTGNTIASPVQLRQEGIPLPKDHLNYGDEWSQGGGKGKGGKGVDSATGANTLPLGPKAKEPSAPMMAPSSKARAPAAAAPRAKEEPSDGGGGSTGSSAAPEAAAAPPRPASNGLASGGSSPSQAAGTSEIERRRAALTEIERRRAEMLAREREAVRGGGAATADAGTPEDGAEARRLAVEARRLQAQQRSREAEAKFRGATAPAPSISVKEEAQEEAAAVGAGDDPSGEGAAVDEAGAAEEVFEEDEEDEVQRAIARRRRLAEEEGIDVAEDDEDPASKRQRADSGGEQESSGAMKLGLQGWAERVNALAADASDEALVTRCRDFVRNRILKAHAEGNLHAVDWDEEPIPTLEALSADG